MWSALFSNPALTRREALCWTAHLYSTEADEITVRTPEDFEQLEHLQDLSDRAYAEATRGLTEGQARKLWQRSLKRFRGES